MKRLYIRFKMLDHTQMSLPDAAKIQMGVMRKNDPIKCFDVKDNEDIDKFIEQLKLTLKSKRIRVQALELVKQELV